MANLRCLFILAIASLLLGAYCCELNRQLYCHQCPFYDSLSYYEQLFRVMTQSREQGLAAALNEACFVNTTVCLPLIVAAMVGLVASPERSVGVWIQAGLLFFFLASLYGYLTQIRQLKPATGLLACFAFLTASAFYDDTGGLSDFRMDLGLCLTFGMTVCWFLSAMARPAWWRFALLGLAAAACCLSRATAPIYLLFSLSPVVIMELLFSSKTAGHRQERVLQLAFSTLIVVGLAGWFYWLNFEYLHFYYGTWNTDANAKIPWLDTLHHPKLVWRCIGNSWAVLILFWTGGLVAARWRRDSSKAFRKAPPRVDWDWRMLWIGIAPVAVMMLLRAGLNPFVCMPAIIGLILFIMLPLLQQMETIIIDETDSAKLPAIRKYFWICLLVCLLISAERGWRRHQQGSAFNTMAAQQRIMDFIIDDAARTGQAETCIGVLQISELNTHGLYSTLLFDRWPLKRNLYDVEINGQIFRKLSEFSFPAAADWALLSGTTETDKMESLIRMAEKQLNYLVVPDYETARRLRTERSYDYVNQFLPKLREKVLAGPWESIAEPVPVQRDEVVEVFRNLDRTKTAKRSEESIKSRRPFTNTDKFD